MSEAMNAPNPVPPPAGSGDARSYEPSMEEILASIRRIIADDQSLPGRGRIEEPASEKPLAREHAQETPEEAASASLHVLTSHEPPAAEAPPRAEDMPGTRATDAVGELVEAPHQSEADATATRGSVADPQHASPEMPMIDSTVAPPALSDRLEAIHHQAQGAPASQEVTAHLGGSNDYFDPPEEYDRPSVVPVDAAPLFSATTNSSVTSAFNVLAASRLADNSDELLGMAREMIRPLLRAWLDENLPTMVERLVRDEIERVARGGR